MSIDRLEHLNVLTTISSIDYELGMKCEGSNNHYLGTLRAKLNLIMGQYERGLIPQETFLALRERDVLFYSSVKDLILSAEQDFKVKP